jgi:Holliday junction resolvase-like predicted endonuclease
MATGRISTLVGQTGEYLVAAELSRCGLIATTFTGNVPHYDIIASDERERHVSVQVKTIRAGTWQFADVAQFSELTFQGRPQIIGKAKHCPVRRGRWLIGQTLSRSESRNGEAEAVTAGQNSAVPGTKERMASAAEWTRRS